MSIKFVIFLSLSCLAIYSSHSLPVKSKLSELPEAIRVLQNPNLFGGDILGFNKTIDGFRNALPNRSALWPMGFIPYTIDSSLNKVKDMIITAMNQYHEKTCIRFQQRTTEPDYVKIIEGDGCYSYVGRIGGQQVVSLGMGCHYIGTIVHELMHAIGFFHEHNRSDRDDYLKVYYENIQQGMANQFVKLDPSDNLLLGPFDFKSVMLYGSTTFNKSRDLKTMVPKDPRIEMIEVYNKYGLSDVDVKIIQRLYQCDD